MFDENIITLAAEVLARCRTAGTRLVTAESCTGGLLAAALTAIPGSSDVFESGFVTYSNDSKTYLLGVPSSLIAAHGAVSEAVARAMAGGALATGQAGIAAAITGVAGPGGQEKPAGLVHFAVARVGRETFHARRDFGDIGRHAVRRAAVQTALALILQPGHDEPHHTGSDSH